MRAIKELLPHFCWKIVRAVVGIGKSIVRVLWEVPLLHLSIEIQVLWELPRLFGSLSEILQQCAGRTIHHYPLRSNHPCIELTFRDLDGAQVNHQMQR